MRDSMEAMRSVGEAEVRITSNYRVGEGSGFHEMEDCPERMA